VLLTARAVAVRRLTVCPEAADLIARTTWTSTLCPCGPLEAVPEIVTVLSCPSEGVKGSGASATEVSCTRPDGPTRRLVAVGTKMLNVTAAEEGET
jgi:hypothetical protein